MLEDVGYFFVVISCWYMCAVTGGVIGKLFSEKILTQKETLALFIVSLTTHAVFIYYITKLYKLLGN